MSPDVESIAREISSTRPDQQEPAAIAESIAIAAEQLGVPHHAVIAWIHDRPVRELSRANLRAWCVRWRFIQPDQPTPATQRLRDTLQERRP